MTLFTSSSDASIPHASRHIDNDVAMQVYWVRCRFGVNPAAAILFPIVDPMTDGVPTKRGTTKVRP